MFDSATELVNWISSWVRQHQQCLVTDREFLDKVFDALADSREDCTARAGEIIQLLSPDEIALFRTRIEIVLSAGYLRRPFGIGGPPSTEDLIRVAALRQTASEKYLKAVLTARGATFPKTHDVHVLIMLLPVECRPELDRPTQVRMTDYATVARYPDELVDPSFAEAHKAVCHGTSRSQRASASFAA